MAKINTRQSKIYTYEGAVASRINPELQLKRSVMATMLWEDQFYEDGVSIADRITNIIPLVAPQKVSDIAIEAREKAKLRHVPLLLVRQMAKLKTHKHLVASTLASIIQRPDELTEFLAIYWKDKRQPLSAQVKRGLAEAFRRFDEYSLSKYNSGRAIRLKDVLFLCHAKPKDDAQAALWKRLIEDELLVPDTWEVALSAGQDKKGTWERLISENKLGGLAFLRNLRNMKETDVSEDVILQGFSKIKTDRILPFQFISAAKYAPQWESQIELAMFKCLEGREKLRGTTALVIDGSGSMCGSPISERSELTRFDAACALAILIREICEKCSIVVFSDNAYTIPDRRGFALRDAINSMAEGLCTNTMSGILHAAHNKYDRIIVITDEQSHQAIYNPIKQTRGYFVNVGSCQNGIAYGEWTHIDGWSESILDYVTESENC